MEEQVLDTAAADVAAGDRIAEREEKRRRRGHQMEGDAKNRVTQPFRGRIGWNRLWVCAQGHSARWPHASGLFQQVLTLDP